MIGFRIPVDLLIHTASGGWCRCLVDRCTPGHLCWLLIDLITAGGPGGPGKQPYYKNLPGCLFHH